MQLTTSPNFVAAMSPEDLEELFSKPPPKLGHPLLREQFLFDPEYINLNHGSYGSLPKPVLAYANYLTHQIESNPDLWLRIKIPAMLKDVRARLASLVGAETDECVLVNNTSTGLNTVLRNFEWHKEDIIIATNTTYGSITRTTQYLHDISPYPSLSILNLNFPLTHQEIISKFRDHIKSIVFQLRGAEGLSELNPTHLTEGKGKIVAVIDSIVSNPGVLLPWQEMVKICREYGIWSVIDAAHSIGQEVDINLGKTRPDFWVSNCHKWLLTKRSLALMYVPKRNQHIIKSSIPTPHTYVPAPGQSNFVDQFGWNGTIDFVPFVCVTAALGFRKWLGGEALINNYCHDLAIRGGKKLAEIMGTDVLDHTENNELTLNMVNVYLPLPSTLLPTISIDAALKSKLLEKYKAYGAHFYHNDKWIVRCSTQVFNELEDFEKLGEILVKVCKEVVDEFGK